MIKSFLFSIVLFPSCLLRAQDSAVIDEAAVLRIMKYLTADSLLGRGDFSPQLVKAAAFIASEYRSACISPLRGYKNYLQGFTSANEGIDADSLFGVTSTNYGVLCNVIGVLPGKSKASEVIVFSAHYDHLGTAESGSDRIFNGANDNASGTAALLALARYYALRNDNERTLLFCAFAGEELGLWGSSFFAKGLDPRYVIANINIEMLGQHNRGGKRSLFITGANQSTLATIFKRNLEGSRIKIVKEPPASKNLYERSDNFSFVQKGIVAHSFMSSDDNDPCYHQPCDELRSIDIPNMKVLIEAIAQGVSSIVSGVDTPKRR